MLLKRRSPPKAAAAAPLAVTGMMLSHPGLVRELNEDVAAYALPGEAGGTGLALVADGMGGHLAGEVASRIAADTVLGLYDELEGSPPERLAASFAAANRAIFERSREDSACAGMGTTCTALAFTAAAAFLGHIGDSRAYLWREGSLRQISEDHSLVAQLVRDGMMTAEEAARSPQRNVILRALGTEPSAQPSIWQKGLSLQPGDRFVLCSDGLSDLVEDAAIAGIVARLPPAEACQALIDAALAGGGIDNVSVGVFAVGQCPPRPEAPRTTRPVEIGGGVS